MACATLLILTPNNKVKIGMMDSSKPILEVKDLVVDFTLRTSNFRAVDKVSFNLYPGKTLCIVGESGSGKSVTARALLQIVGTPGDVTGGEILYTTKEAVTIDVAKLNPRSKEIRSLRGGDIAMIFQEPMTSLSPVHTIGQQIIEAIRLHTTMDKKAARLRAIDLLKQVEIPNAEKAIDRYTFEYSGGMRQRAMIAMALACEPRVLIADEPTTALDVTTQADILDLMAKLQRDFGMAMLFITHDMGVVAEIADEVAVMHLGKMVEKSTVDNVFHHAQAPYTKMLIGSVIKLEQPAGRPSTVRADLPPLLEVKNLSKVFTTEGGWFKSKAEQFRAVDNISLNLMQGETLGIVGESGSGKTTLGRCIMRIIEPTSGSIQWRQTDGSVVEICDMDKKALRHAYREMRMIFQDPYSSLNPRMTVGQIIGEPLLVNGFASGAELARQVGDLIEQIGLPRDVAERYPHAFSGGQRQRISIARALALKPRLILADEATSALDVSIRTQILDLLLDFKQSLGLSFIFISHDISVIRYFCDRVAVMYKGQVVEQGLTQKITRAPTHDYTKSLLSAVPIPDPRQRGIANRLRYNQNAMV
jgi:peptide/nickel transport system ATP-binding protein